MHVFTYRVINFNSPIVQQNTFCVRRPHILPMYSSRFHGKYPEYIQAMLLALYYDNGESRYNHLLIQAVPQRQ